MRLRWNICPVRYDQRADSAAQCVQLLTQGDRPQVRTATVYAFEGVNGDELNRIKHYIINPVESREASMAVPDTLDMPVTAPEDVKHVEGFISMPFNEVETMVKQLGFAMSAEDLAFCQKYFAETEHRDPTMTELRAIDTYWSDHCRHTTFLSAIDGVEIDTGLLSTPIAEAYGEYMRTRTFIDDKRDVSLMDLAIIGMKALRRDGRLNDLDESEEINACSIVVEADVDGQHRADGWSCSRTRRTTIPPRSSLSAARLPAWAALSATRSVRSFVCLSVLCA